MPEWFEEVTMGDLLDRQAQPFGERRGLGRSARKHRTGLAGFLPHSPAVSRALLRRDLLDVSINGFCPGTSISGMGRTDWVVWS